MPALVPLNCEATAVADIAAGCAGGGIIAGGATPTAAADKLAHMHSARAIDMSTSGRAPL